jgi:hypothetical protein
MAIKLSPKTIKVNRGHYFKTNKKLPKKLAV